MKKGEVAPLTISPDYTFGSSESEQELAKVPPNSTVSYKVELVSFDKKKSRLLAGKRKKGTHCSKQASMQKPQRYEKAAKYIEHDSSCSEDEKKQAKALKITCNLNDAACKLKLEDFKQAEKPCTKVLELESTNVKALYRRGQAYMNMADLDLAEFDIKKALELNPNNRYCCS